MKYNLFIILFILLVPFQTEASVRDSLRHWCERNLIGEDPYPHAEATSAELLFFFRETRDEKMLKELVYRYRHGLMKQSHMREFWELIGGGHE